MMSLQIQRAHCDGIELEYVAQGAGEPVVCIHGALIADAFAPLLAEPVLATRYRLIHYRRRGYAGSTHAPGPTSIPQQAADCRALLRELDVERAHVAGHSLGGVIALQLALDAPEVVHSLVLFEPAMLDVPSGALLAAALEPPIQSYQAGRKEEAVDGFLRVAIGRDYRPWLEQVIPGGYAQAVGDADTFLGAELPALGEWRLTREDARRIGQPVLSVLGSESAKDWAAFPEVHARLQEWLPHAEPFVLPGANHALEYMNPRGAAEALAAFFTRHPIPAPVLAASPAPGGTT
jgi:pimeloyl-ACP methyl ester carboxylesterase